MNEPRTHLGTLPPGTRLHNFQIRDFLGRGGFGISYLGWDVNLKKKVAIKEYMPIDIAVRDYDLSVHPVTQNDRNDYEWGLNEFLEEAQKLASFDHPGIVKVHQYFEAYSTAYFVMDYLEGQTLAAVYKDQNILKEPRLRTILMSILDALEQVHATGFLHRDIKPGNIIFNKGNTPVLIDFGAARAAVATRSQNITAIVAPGFSPIEQYSTSGDQGFWTDIYALGAVLYRGMTGIVPDDSTTRVTDDRLLPAAQAAAGKYGKSLTDAVDWALRLRVSDRPQSLEEWCEVLEGGKTRPRSTSANSRDSRPPPPPRKSRKSLWLAALGVAAVLTAGGFAIWKDEIAGILKWNFQGLFESCSRHKAERRYAAASRHMDERRYAAALACYREVRKRDPGHADAQAKVTDLETVVAWKEAEKKKTVEGYYRFLQVNQDPLFADFARRRLHKLEPNYWREVVLKKKTKAAYLRYLEIYPKGKFIDSAKQGAARAE